jgi:hypothetical protein
MAAPHSIFQRLSGWGNGKFCGPRSDATRSPPPSEPRTSPGSDRKAPAWREQKLQEAQRARDALSECKPDGKRPSCAQRRPCGSPHPSSRSPRLRKASRPRMNSAADAGSGGDAKRLRRRLRASEQEAVGSLEEATARTEQALAQSMTAAAEGLSDLKNAATEFGFGWGLGSSTGATRQEIEGLHELAERLKSSSQLKQILEALGWAKRMESDEAQVAPWPREVHALPHSGDRPRDRGAGGTNGADGGGPGLTDSPRLPPPGRRRRTPP